MRNAFLNFSSLRFSKTSHTTYVHILVSAKIHQNEKVEFLFQKNLSDRLTNRQNSTFSLIEKMCHTNFYALLSTCFFLSTLQILKFSVVFVWLHFENETPLNSLFCTPSPYHLNMFLEHSKIRFFFWPRKPRFIFGQFK